MSSNIKASIIIPNLNSPIIDKTINSLIEQKTEIEFEIIVVGIDKFNLIKSDTNQVKFIKTKKPTPPAIARNMGASTAKGDFLFFIDADCVASPQWLNNHLRAHQAVNRLSVIGGGVIFPNDNYWTFSDNISTFHEFMTHLPRQEKKMLPSINVSIPKNIWDLTNGFNENYPYPAGEDSELTLKIHTMKYPIIFEPEATVVHMPNRNRFIDLIRHAYRFGQYSIKSNAAYWDILFVPFPLRHWLLTILFSPILSAYVIFKIVLKEKLPLKYWHTLPIIYILKIIWCFGFASQLKSQKD